MKKSEAEKLGKRNAPPKPSFFELEMEKRIERIERILSMRICLEKIKGEN